MKRLEVQLGLAKKQFNRDLFEAQQELQRFSRDMRKGMEQIGGGSLQVATGIAGIGLAFNQMAKVDESFFKLQKQLGLGTEEAGSLRDEVYGLNAALGKNSALETADLLRKVALQSGETGDSLYQLTKNTGVLADSFGEEERILKAQVTLMKTFSTSATQAGDSVGFLASKGGDLRGELFDSLNEYANQFEESGFNLQQTVAMIGAGLENSWSIDKSADAFKEARLRLFGGDAVTQESLQKLGLGGLTDDIKTGGVGLEQAYSQIFEKMQGFNKVERFRIGTGIFGTQFEDAGEKAIFGMLNSMSREIRQSGTMATIHSELEQQFFWKWNAAVSNVNNSVTEMFEQMKPVMSPLLDEISEGADSLREFSQRYKYITRAIGLSGVGVFAAALSFGLLKIGVGAAKMSLDGMKTAAKLATSKIGILGMGVGWLAYELIKLEAETGAVSKAWENAEKIWTPSLENLSKEFNKHLPTFNNGLEELKTELGLTFGLSQKDMESFGTLFGSVIAGAMDETTKFIPSLAQVPSNIATILKDGKKLAKDSEKIWGPAWEEMNVTLSAGWKDATASLILFKNEMNTWFLNTTGEETTLEAWAKAIGLVFDGVFTSVSTASDGLFSFISLLKNLENWSKDKTWDNWNKVTEVAKGFGERTDERIYNSPALRALAKSEVGQTLILRNIGNKAISDFNEFVQKIAGGIQVPHFSPIPIGFTTFPIEGPRAKSLQEVILNEDESMLTEAINRIRATTETLGDLLTWESLKFGNLSLAPGAFGTIPIERPRAQRDVILRKNETSLTNNSQKSNSQTQAPNSSKTVNIHYNIQNYNAKGNSLVDDLELQAMQGG